MSLMQPRSLNLHPTVPFLLFDLWLKSSHSNSQTHTQIHTFDWLSGVFHWSRCSHLLKEWSQCGSLEYERSHSNTHLYMWAQKEHDHRRVERDCESSETTQRDLMYMIDSLKNHPSGKHLIPERVRRRLVWRGRAFYIIDVLSSRCMISQPMHHSMLFNEHMLSGPIIFTIYTCLHHVLSALLNHNLSWYFRVCPSSHCVRNDIHKTEEINEGDRK